jgi:hypothetical protein
MGIYIEHDGLVDDTAFSTCNFVSQRDNVSLNLVGEVIELLAWNFLEDTPRLGVLILNVIQTQLKWSSSNHTLIIYYELYKNILHLL